MIFGWEPLFISNMCLFFCLECLFLEISYNSWNESRSKFSFLKQIIGRKSVGTINTTNYLSIMWILALSLYFLHKAHLMQQFKKHYKHNSIFCLSVFVLTNFRTFFFHLFCNLKIPKYLHCKNCCSLELSHNLVSHQAPIVIKLKVFYVFFSYLSNDVRKQFVVGRAVSIKGFFLEIKGKLSDCLVALLLQNQQN